jgi:colicin import membrane protein
MPRPLKTFQAHLGFYDTVVAAPSRAAALKAWGSRQNLFRDGSASETKDAQAVTAALAKPGVVLRRPAGSSAPFSENPGLPRIPNIPKKDLPKQNGSAKASPQKPVAAQKPRLAIVPRPAPPSPSRAPVEAAEKSLADIKRDEQRALASLEQRKAALDDEERRLRAEFRARREKAEKALSEARKAYSRALSRR